MKQTLQLELLPLLHPPTIAGALASPIGRIAAGFPLEAVEDREHNQLLDLLAAPGRYALCVGDDSMIAAGVFNVDIVIIKSQQRQYPRITMSAFVKEIQIHESSMLFVTALKRLILG